MYEQREYLSNIKSPEIRSIFTKFRLDTNCTLGSLRRSFRNNKITNSTCICGEEVKHVLFNCKNKEIISICEHFEDRYCRYVKNFKAKPVSSKTLEILNVIPNCHIPDREKAKSLICTFVK